MGYSLTSKAYRVLNKRSKRIEETYYVTFNDNYMKKVQRSESDLREIFLESGEVSVPIANLFEEYMRLFDEPEKAAHSEAKAANKKIDNLKKIIDEAAKEMESEPPKAKGDPPSTDSKFQGESSTPLKTNEVSFEGENPTPTEDANFDAAIDYTSPVKGEKENTTNEGDDDQSEFEVEVNAELDPAYDPNSPPLVKWTKDHPKAQIIGEASEKVLTCSQLKAKQTALFSKVEFCMFNSFVSKIEPKTVNVALDHSDWVQAMQDELHEFERNRVWRLIPRCFCGWLEVGLQK